MSVVNDFSLVRGEAANEVFATVETLVETAKAIFKSQDNRVVKRSLSYYGSDDELLIQNGAGITVNFSAGDTENLPASGTFELWIYDADNDEWVLWFDGDITVTEGTPSEDPVVFEDGYIGKTTSEVADVNALTVKPNYDLIQAGAAKRVYRKNAEGEYEEVHSGMNFAGFLQTLKKLAAAENCEILHDIQLIGFDLSGVVLAGGELNGANLTNCNLTDSDLEGVYFPSAILIGTNFTGVNLGESNLTNANLTNANFTGADLSDTNLPGANLTNATLTGANLTNANFIGANLTDAALPENADTKAEFKAVVGEGSWDAVTTIWIDGNPIGA